MPLYACKRIVVKFIACFAQLLSQLRRRLLHNSSRQALIEGPSCQHCAVLCAKAQIMYACEKFTLRQQSSSTVEARTGAPDIIYAKSILHLEGRSRISGKTQDLIFIAGSDSPESPGVQAGRQRYAVLVPCRQAMKGRFPLHGTYFQTNEVFLDGCDLLARQLKVHFQSFSDRKGGLCILPRHDRRMQVARRLNPNCQRFPHMHAAVSIGEMLVNGRQKCPSTIMSDQ